MNEPLEQRREPSLDAPSGFHPLVYKAAIGFVALFVAAAWVAFDRQSDIELPLAMLSVLLFVAVLLPYLLWRIWRTGQTRPPTLKTNKGFRKWMKGSTQVWQSRLKNSDAAIDMLLPLAAVALGLVALGIVFELS
ncbi:hypothetical protein QCM77_04780 [Bradyrhizobium sp. SSUT18]|uniref:hypothetical protein n=1 Tax=unclassified Bradyrhizobium TaxID=2631580 RepID=UPI00244B860B|nr:MULTISPECIES: hypothetical protein [unclassified Bradyrhizobium]MDH2341206.1 hypothetical protein [Bradyrhizobium sp. SSUT77]MDH2351914.1 hypothetical protein [Bradyrhizobium sp. SSUT112]MDH2399264.1 hypothetical protein [Bradyrhizobium sp. SSUT18]